MKFSQFSIKNQEFNKSFRGYDPDEVKIFLERMSEWFSIVQTENEQLKNELNAAEEQISEFKRIEKNLQNALINAQESANSAKEEARKHTAIIVEEASIKSSRIIEKAKEEELNLRKKISELDEARKLLLSKLRATIETQAKVLGMEDEIPPSKFSVKPEMRVEKSKSNIDVDKIVEKLL